MHMRRRNRTDRIRKQNQLQDHSPAMTRQWSDTNESPLRRCALGRALPLLSSNASQPRFVA